MKAQRDTPTELMDLAQELIQTRGYHAFSYRDLAETIGIKTASIHYHFPKKEDLILGLLNRYRQGFAECLKNLDSRYSKAEKRLQAYGALFHKPLSDGRICLCGSLASDISTLSEVIGQAVEAFFDENVKWVTKTLKEGALTGEFDLSTKPIQIARAFVAALEGAMLTGRSMGAGDRWVRSVLEFFLRNLR